MAWAEAQHFTADQQYLPSIASESDLIIPMIDQKQKLWNRFCDEHRIIELGVPLFDCNEEGRVASGPFGKDATRNSA